MSYRYIFIFVTICLCNGLFSMNIIEKNMELPNIGIIFGLDNLTSDRLKKIETVRLYDVVQKREYKDIISNVSIYFDNDIHKFRKNWYEMLNCIQDEYIFSSIMHDGGSSFSQIVDKFYVWCEVTAEVICNYDSYSISEEYGNKIGKKLIDALSKMRGDKSMLLDDFMEILLDPSAMFASEIPVKMLRWSLH